MSKVDMSEESKLPVLKVFYSTVELGLYEEFLFRFLPLFVGIKLFGPSYPVLVIALLYSLLFGYIHSEIWWFEIEGFKIRILKKDDDSPRAPVWKYLVAHGGAGYIFSLGYLASGGFANQHILALANVTSAHVLVNFCHYCARMMSFERTIN